MLGLLSFSGWRLWPCPCLHILPSMQIVLTIGRGRHGSSYRCNYRISVGLAACPSVCRSCSPSAAASMAPHMEATQWRHGSAWRHFRCALPPAARCPPRSCFFTIQPSLFEQPSLSYCHPAGAGGGGKVPRRPWPFLPAGGACAELTTHFKSTIVERRKKQYAFRRRCWWRRSALRTLRGWGPSSGRSWRASGAPSSSRRAAPFFLSLGLFSVPLCALLSL